MHFRLKSIGCGVAAGNQYIVFMKNWEVKIKKPCFLSAFQEAGRFVENSTAGQRPDCAAIVPEKPSRRLIYTTEWHVEVEQLGN